MKTNMNINQTKRLLLCILLAISLFGCALIVYITIILPSTHMMPWPFQMLILGNMFLPEWVLYVYLMYKILPPTNGKTPTKGFRKWVITYILVFAIVLYWVLWASIFEVFTPFLSTGIRGLGLPFFVYLITILVLTRTRLRDRFEKLLRSLFKEDIN